MGQGIHGDSALHMSKRCGEFGNTTISRHNHFKAECTSVWRQQMNWRLLESCRSIHAVRQDDKPQPIQQNQDRNLDSVNLKYPNFDNVKSAIITKLRVYCESKKGVHNIQN